MSKDISPDTAGGAVASEARPKPAKAGRFSSAVKAAEADIRRVVDAIERWYAEHYHTAAVRGSHVISADDKAALIKHVSEAVANPPQE